MVIAIALLGFDDLRQSLLFEKQILFTITSTLSKINTNSVWEVKKISRFLSTRHRIQPSYGCKALENMLNEYLFYKGNMEIRGETRLTVSRG